MAVARMHLPELADIHDQFLWLTGPPPGQFAGRLGGKLLLRLGFDPAGIAAVVAASTAGAASLCVEANGSRLREGLRAGLCDFVVTHLDEALRILKNEIRRARPISVGLTADPQSGLNAMIDRGLQPDLIAAVPDSEGRIFIERGAVPLPDVPSPDPATSLLEWVADVDPALLLPRVAALAAGCLDPQRPDTPARRRWLEQSPRYLGRAFGTRQCLRMTAPEIASFLPRATSQIPAVKITRDG
jgi:hypothetical protein